MRKGATPHSRRGRLKTDGQSCAFHLRVKGGGDSVGSWIGWRRRGREERVLKYSRFYMGKRGVRMCGGGYVIIG